MAMRTCKDCGKEYSNSAKSCPHCGAANPKLVGLKIAQLVAVIFFCLVVFWIYKSFTSEKKTNSYSQTPVERHYVLDVRPDSQRKFEEICRKYKLEFDAGANELQKSTARNNRKKALQQLGVRTANNWVGTINILDTNNDGKGVISIKLDDNTYVSTWNNALSDSLTNSNTLISTDSNLFKSFASLKKGSKVKFSGNFFSNSDLDYLKTQGMTVNDAMKNVEFLMKFTSVTALKDKPFASADINMREGPSADTAKIMTVKQGTTVKLLGDPSSNGWVKISIDNKEGYVNRQYLGY